MAKRKLDKTDIGEMYHLASSAFYSGFLKVEIDSDHAMELCERALDNSRLTEENAKLREALEGLIESASVNEKQLNDLLMCGNYGELKELCDAKQLLNQLKDQNNDK